MNRLKAYCFAIVIALACGGSSLADHTVDRTLRPKPGAVRGALTAGSFCGWSHPTSVRCCFCASTRTASGTISDNMSRAERCAIGGQTFSLGDMLLEEGTKSHAGAASAVRKGPGPLVAEKTFPWCYPDSTRAPPKRA